MMDVKVNTLQEKPHTVKSGKEPEQAPVTSKKRAEPVDWDQELNWFKKNRWVFEKHKGEWVAPQELVNDPLAGTLISVLEGMRVGGMKGFADGGFTTLSETQIQKQLLSIEDVLGRTQPVLLMPDLITESTKVNVIQDRTTL